MKDFKTIKDTCIANSEMFSRVVEDFLLYNVVNPKKLGTEVNMRFAPYRHITKEFQDGWINMFIMQYIIHKIFKRDGLIKNYLNHSAVQRLSQHDRNYLLQLASHPWKFSFSAITGKPAEHFFEMEDVFTDESFLLYSPGIADINREQRILLWFNLIGYNGECWQSYGPIGAYQSFQPDDIFFFATELQPDKWIENGHDVMDDVEENPVPYMMLLSGSVYPLTFHKDDQIVEVAAEYDFDSFDPKGLDKNFKIEYAGDVYRLSLKRWAGPPHFSMAYYDEKKKVLRLHSMTDRGFTELVNRLNSYGYNLSTEPDIRVNTSMIVTAGNILKKKIILNEYDSLFIKEQPVEDNEQLNKLNSLFAMALPEINAGRKPDIETLARKAGVEVETARDLLEQVMNKLDDMQRRRGKFKSSGK